MPSDTAATAAATTSNPIMMPTGITFFRRNAAHVKSEKNTCMFRRRLYNNIWSCDFFRRSRFIFMRYRDNIETEGRSAPTLIYVLPVISDMFSARKSTFRTEVIWTSWTTAYEIVVWRMQWVGTPNICTRSRSGFLSPNVHHFSNSWHATLWSLQAVPISSGYKVGSKSSGAKVHYYNGKHMISTLYLIPLSIRQMVYQSVHG